MSELLEWDGVWSPALINLMVPVAEEILAERTAQMFNAVAAGSGSLFSEKPGALFREALDQVRKNIKRAQYAARGVEAPPVNVADAVLAALKKIAAAGRKRR